MASALSLNSDTPWDILRAQLLWSIWCQKTTHTFRSEKFHLGLVLWHAWRNTIYCAMEAYKELFRHKRNEEKRQEAITCFQQIWTTENVFGRLQVSTIKWNVTPHPEFLPKELGAWTVPPIRINRLSPSPDVEAEFTARPDFSNLVDAFVRGVGNDWQPTMSNDTDSQQGDSLNDITNTPVTGHTRAEPTQPSQSSVQETQADSQTSYRTSTDNNTRLSTSPTQSKGSASTHQREGTQHVPAEPTVIDNAERTHDNNVYFEQTSTGSHLNNQDTPNLPSTAQASGEKRKVYIPKDTYRTSDQGHRLQQPGEKHHGQTQVAGHDAEQDYGCREDHQQVCSQLPSNTQPYISSDTKEGRQGKGTESTSKQIQTEGTKTIPVGGRAQVGVQPRSRPKRRCSKSLHHPSQKTQREQGSQIRHQSGLEQTHLNQSWAIRAGIPPSPTARNKPTSRPKRKCRFGPRARRSQREHYCEEARKTKSKSATERQTTEGHHGLHSPSAQELPFQEGNPIDPDLAPPSDRVTLQPTAFPRRTPFDHHQRKRDTRQPEVNTIRHVTHRFEAKLTEEIDELLREIEATRRGASNTNNQDRDFVELERVTEVEFQGETQQQRQGEVSNSPLMTENKEYTPCQVQCDPSPSPSRTRPQEHSALNEQDFRYTLGAADGTWLDHEHDGGKLGQDLTDDTQVILPDRLTLSHFS